MMEVELQQARQQQASAAGGGAGGAGRSPPDRVAPGKRRLHGSPERRGLVGAAEAAWPDEPPATAGTSAPPGSVQLLPPPPPAAALHHEALAAPRVGPAAEAVGGWAPNEARSGATTAPPPMPAAGPTPVAVQALLQGRHRASGGGATSTATGGMAATHGTAAAAAAAALAAAPPAPAGVPVPVVALPPLGCSLSVLQLSQPSLWQRLWCSCGHGLQALLAAPGVSPSAPVWGAPAAPGAADGAAALPAAYGLPGSVLPALQQVQQQLQVGRGRPGREREAECVCARRCRCLVSIFPPPRTPRPCLVTVPLRCSLAAAGRGVGGHGQLLQLREGCPAGTGAGAKGHAKACSTLAWLPPQPLGTPPAHPLRLQTPRQSTTSPSPPQAMAGGLGDGPDLLHGLLAFLQRAAAGPGRPPGSDRGARAASPGRQHRQEALVPLVGAALRVLEGLLQHSAGCRAAAGALLGSPEAQVALQLQLHGSAGQDGAAPGGLQAWRPLAGAHRSQRPQQQDRGEGANGNGNGGGTGRPGGDASAAPERPAAPAVRHAQLRMWTQLQWQNGQQGGPGAGGPAGGGLVVTLLAVAGAFGGASDDVLMATAGCLQALASALPAASARQVVRGTAACAPDRPCRFLVRRRARKEPQGSRRAAVGCARFLALLLIRLHPVVVFRGSLTTPPDFYCWSGLPQKHTPYTHILACISPPPPAPSGAAAGDGPAAAARAATGEQQRGRARRRRRTAAAAARVPRRGCGARGRAASGGGSGGGLAAGRQRRQRQQRGRRHAGGCAVATPVFPRWLQTPTHAC